MKSLTLEILELGESPKEAFEAFLTCLQCNVDEHTNVDLKTNGLTVSMLQCSVYNYRVASYDDPRIIIAPEGYEFVGDCDIEGIRLNLFLPHRDK